MKLYRWVFVVGIVLIAAGLIIYSISNVWDAKSIAVILAGFIGVIYSLIKLNIREILKNKRLLYTGNALLVILLVIGILGLFNFLLVRHSWRVDTTSNRLFSLSDQTVKVLKGLKKEVNVIAFVRSVDKGAIADRLSEYSHISRHFKWEIIDPDKQPAVARRYKIKQYGSLAVICEDREEQISSASEQEITNAIIKVTREKKKKVYFVTGHGEWSINDNGQHGYSRAKEGIESQNYDVDEIFLAEIDSIPEDASVVVVTGPKKMFFEHELEMLTSYLNRGGSALFMLDPRPSIGLESYMKNWYVDVGDNLVVDASGVGRLFGAGPDIPLVSSYGDHPIVEAMGNYMTFFPMTRSIRPASKKDTLGIEVKELAKTSPRSFAVHDVEEIYKTGKIKIGPADIRGPVPIACATTIDVTSRENRIRDKARIVTVGDSDFATNSYFGNQANGDLFMNMISWLLADEDLISIRPKTPELRMINMTAAQLKTVFWLSVVILPAISFGIAILVFVRRR